MRYSPVRLGWRKANQTGLRSTLPLRTRRTETFTISVPRGSRIVKRRPWPRTCERRRRCVVRSLLTANRLRAAAAAAAAAGVTPVPESVTLPLPPAALLDMSRDAGRAPPAVGTNWTVTVHDWPDVNMPAHVFATTRY